MNHPNYIPIEEIKAAQTRISRDLEPTPLTKLNFDNTPAEIYLKLENLQPIRSFKIRGAINALSSMEPEMLKKGVWTNSAGNWAQGLAWAAKKLGIKCTIILPTHAPETKVEKILQLGAEIIKAPVDKYFEVYYSRTFEGVKGTFVHAFGDPAVMAGNGTIGLEILKDLPRVDTILVAWGGGGLTCGIASAIHEIKPDVKIYACEIETCTPLTLSYKLGRAATDIEYVQSFVDGIGGPIMLPEMWKMAKSLIDGTIVVSLEETANAIRILAEWNSIIVEGAGAVSLAAALSGKAGSGKIACIVSGGNIDKTALVKILEGKIPY